MDFMAEALKEAQKALKYDEVPIGCVIVKDGKILSRGFNRKVTKQDATCHAEIEAIRKAVKKDRKLASGRLRPLCNTGTVSDVHRSDHPEPDPESGFCDTRSERRRDLFKSSHRGRSRAESLPADRRRRPSGRGFFPAEGILQEKAE